MADKIQKAVLSLLAAGPRRISDVVNELKLKAGGSEGIRGAVRILLEKRDVELEVDDIRVIRLAKPADEGADGSGDDSGTDGSDAGRTSPVASGQ